MDKRPDGSHKNGQKKWSKGGRGRGGGRGGGKPDRSAASGVQLMGNKWICFCKRKECGWNTTHTYGFHSAWVQNKSSFNIHATHKFRVNSGTASETSKKGEPPTDASTAGSSMTGFIRHTGALVVIVNANKDSTKYVL